PAFANTTCSVDRVCVPIAGDPTECTRNAECAERLGGPARCRPDRRCAALEDRTLNCKLAPGDPKDYLDDRTVFLGGYHVAGAAGEEMFDAIQFALQQFTSYGALPAGPGEAPRRVAVVDCVQDPQPEAVNVATWNFLQNVVQVP